MWHCQTVCVGVSVIHLEQYIFHTITDLVFDWLGLHSYEFVIRVHKIHSIRWTADFVLLNCVVKVQSWYIPNAEDDAMLLPIFQVLLITFFFHVSALTRVTSDEEHKFSYFRLCMFPHPAIVARKDFCFVPLRFKFQVKAWQLIFNHILYTNTTAFTYWYHSCFFSKT